MMLGQMQLQKMDKELHRENSLLLELTYVSQGCFLKHTTVQPRNLSKLLKDADVFVSTCH